MDNKSLEFHLLEILKKEVPGAELGIDIADSEAWNGIKHYHFFANNDAVVAFGLRGVCPDKRSFPG